MYFLATPSAKNHGHVLISFLRGKLLRFYLETWESEHNIYQKFSPPDQRGINQLKGG
jgi:hypothetical protein